MSVETMALTQLGMEDLLRWVDLHRLVWQSLQDREALLARRLGQRDAAQTAQWSQAQVHLVRRAGQIAAICYSFHRVIALGSTQRTVLALAGVSTHPDWRRQGLGATVVRAAWARVAAPVTVCLFQTDVPAWYERLGARCIDNRIANSIGDGRAFWSSHAMIFPSAGPWTSDPIDLLGPGW